MSVVNGNTPYLIEFIEILMQILRNLRELITKSAQYQMLILLHMMVIGMVLEVMGLGLVFFAIALMTQPDIAQRYPSLEWLLKSLNYREQTSLIFFGALSLVVVYLIKVAFLILMNWQRNKFIFGVQASLSRKLFDGYMKQPWDFHLQRNSAQLIHNAMHEVGFFCTVLLQSMLIFLAEGTVFIGMSFALLIMEPIGTAIVLCFFALVVLVFHSFIRRRLSLWGETRQHFDACRLQYLQQGLGGVKEAKLLGRESDFVNQYDKQNVASLSISEKLGTLAELPRLVLELLLVLSIACVMMSVLAQGKSAEVLLQTIGLFAAAAFRLMPSVNRILGAMQNLRYSSPCIFTLHREVKLLAEGIVVCDGKKVGYKDKIVLHNVSYRYADAQYDALDSISLIIHQGASIGIIGQSGAGKSTLVDVILGLLTPCVGMIRVDDIDIQTRLRSWQDQIGYVPQTIFLTDDTLRRNIAFGLSDDQIDDVAVNKAIKSAHLDEYILSLPLGVETFVGERGVRLSGGQRQRVGIARALYHNPKVLVLDEATSSLDTAVEKEVMDDINALQGEKTLIIVAHRLSTLEKCDYIYRLEKGKIVDSGRYMDVINRDKVCFT